MDAKINKKPPPHVKVGFVMKPLRASSPKTQDIIPMFVRAFKVLQSEDIVTT